MSLAFAICVEGLAARAEPQIRMVVRWQPSWQEELSFFLAEKER